ncbi:hypothetical protein U1Q18_028794 [Sarracenia purpurea var. burkii]
MSIALESRTSDRIERSGLRHGMSCGTVYDSTEAGRVVPGIFAGDLRLTEANTPMAQNVEEREEEVVDSSSSSSIGRNSDSSGGESDDDGKNGDGEVQSSYKGPLGTLEALEEVLPMKRGISKFYCGKSRSFTSLAAAVSCSSIKEIAKPENAYTRKRKNLLAYSTFWDKNRDTPLRSNSGSISKKLASSSKSTLALAMTTSSYESNNNNENFSSSPPTLCRPPLHPRGRRSSNYESSPSPPKRNFSPWRSFSLSDLQCAVATNPSFTDLVVSRED